MPQQSKAQFYTGSNHEFGQNRVQYNQFFWQSYDYERFKVYFYAGGKKHAIYAAKAIQANLKELEKAMDFDVSDKLEFLVFNSMSHFKQSNIGLTNDSQSNIGGVTRIVGSKVFIYYDGDHRGFEKQIRAGLTEVIVNQMMYGGNWKDVLKNSTFLTLPDWYLKGFISYSANDWDDVIDNWVRDGILTNRYKNFNRLEGLDAERAGHSIWNYIAEVYGENVIPNVLYMTKVSRNIESGFLFVLGVSLRTLMTNYNRYYQKRYEGDISFRQDPTMKGLEFKQKKKYHYSQFKMSPNGKYAGFVTNEMGQYKIWVYDIGKDKLKKVAKGNHRLNRLVDRSYPILAWHPTSKAIAYVTEEKGDVLMNIYAVEDKKGTSKPLLRIDKVLDMSYSDDGRSMVMSAVAGGQTDLYLYKVVGNSTKKLTDDIYDDMNPSFIDNSTRIIFTSNRVDDTLRASKKVPIERYSMNNDVFILDLKKSIFLTRITNTPYVHEESPYQYDADHYCFLSNKNGIRNRFIAYYDSTISHVDTAVHYRYFSVTDPVTNYSRSILEHNVSWKKGKISQLIFMDGKYHFYTGKTSDDKLLSDDDLIPTQYMRYQLALNDYAMPVIDSNGINKVEQHDPEDTDGNVDIDNFQFETDKPTYEKEVVKLEEDDEKKEKEVEEKDEYEQPRQAIYNVNFTTNYIVSQIDNSFLNQSYQRISGGAYQNPGFNGMVKLGIIDLMEDYRITGGFRFPANLNSSEYMLVFENMKGRLDKKYLASRQGFTTYADDAVQKIQTYDFKYNMRYPFSEVSSLRLTLNARNDRIISSSVDQSSLLNPNDNDYWGGAKLEYVYDHTISKGLNLYNGIRLKLWGEIYHELDKKESDFIVVGADVRHYLQIHRDIIWANRFAASSSFGHQRLLYYLGGVDNWLNPQFDPDIQIAQDQNYQFQTIATPVRGFFQNARNGNTMAVVNSEIRFPIVKYFSSKPLKSDFLENFQIVGFADAAAAWTGWDPYSVDNSFNTTVIEQKPVIITIHNQREPIVYGYGGGVRSRLFGYFVRFDIGWGVNDGTVFEPVKYLSLSLDF